ncbi:lytic transglycosylase domain-containing protein [Geomonas sp.]|uniref:lytic transglycosylase domain-containing protein n=1 Tax=Geomonas sp. TaxID=2651584 RepID=UPI002B495FC7|nr:lytic transglycosylase domain-containing protein [Geomonas sp.]HJV33426.1 lytic transglycosylase domain-containing protein [Geomonas sp.]
MQSSKIAVIAATLLLAVFVGSQLQLFHLKGGASSGAQGELSNQNAGVSTCTADDQVKITVLANILQNYTNAHDAMKTAFRYHNETSDPELWTAMTIVESKGRSKAVSERGAQGKLQVMPFWKKQPGFEFYSRKYSHLNDSLNFRAAHKIFRRLLAQQKGDKWLAVERYCGVGPAAREYVAKVRNLYERIKWATDQAVLSQRQRTEDSAGA